MTSLEKAKAIARALDEKKATEIRIIDISEVSILGDYFVLASGNSSTQVQALANEVEKALAEKGEHYRRMEGYQSASWILLDYSDVIVHIFHAQTREFYSLERLWADAREIKIDS